MSLLLAWSDDKWRSCLSLSEGARFPSSLAPLAPHSEATFKWSFAGIFWSVYAVIIITTSIKVVLYPVSVFYSRYKCSLHLGLLTQYVSLYLYTLAVIFLLLPILFLMSVINVQPCPHHSIKTWSTHLLLASLRHSVPHSKSEHPSVWLVFI